MKVGEFIRIYRIEHGMTQEQFAARVGVSKAYISMIENNQNSTTKKPIVLSIDVAYKLSKAMNISLDELMMATPDQRIAIKEKNEDDKTADFVRSANYLLGKIPEDKRDLAINLLKEIAKSK